MKRLPNDKHITPFFCHSCRAALHENNPCHYRHKCEGIKTGKSCLNWITAWEQITDKCAAKNCTGYPDLVSDPDDPDEYFLSEYCHVHLRRQERERAKESKNSNVAVQTAQEKLGKKLKRAKIAYFRGPDDANKTIAECESEGYYLESVHARKTCDVAVFRKNE